MATAALSLLIELTAVVDGLRNRIPGDAAIFDQVRRGTGVQVGQGLCACPHSVLLVRDNNHAEVLSLVIAHPVPVPLPPPQG